MIVVDLPVKMRCTEPNCTAEQPTFLVLLTSGGFGFHNPSALWQIRAPMKPGQMLAAYEARCPTHAVHVQPATALVKAS